MYNFLTFLRFVTIFLKFWLFATILSQHIILASLIPTYKRYRENDDTSDDTSLFSVIHNINISAGELNEDLGKI